MIDAEAEARWTEMCNGKTLQPEARAGARWPPLPVRRAQRRRVSARSSGLGKGAQGTVHLIFPLPG
eukprot:10446769-Lingulodinium_polyedra.AAC.1